MGWNGKTNEMNSKTYAINPSVPPNPLLPVGNEDLLIPEN